MKWMPRAKWLVAGAVFVLLFFDAYALWSVNRLLAVASLVLDGLMLVYFVVAGYHSGSKEQR